MLKTPPGYTLLEPQKNLHLLVRQGMEELVASCGLQRFPARTAGADGPLAAGGRSAIQRVSIDSGPPLLVKTYRRGGIFGGLRGSTYLNASRRLEEINVCDAAMSAGLLVPPIQCFWIQRASLLGYRLAAATREIENAETLFHALHRPDDAVEERRRLVASVADAVRTLHDAGIHHPDLNLGNILVAPNGEIHLIDFDRARLLGRPLSRGMRNGALARIYRSLVKLSRPDPPPLSSEEKELFLSRYRHDQTGEDPGLRRRCRRELAFHRLWWRLVPSGNREKG